MSAIVCLYSALKFTHKDRHWLVEAINMIS